MTAPLLRLVAAESALVARRRPLDPDALAGATRILQDVDSRGEAAALEHARRLGDLRAEEPVVYGRAALRAAFEALPADQQGVLERTAFRIRTFARAQRSCFTDLSAPVEGGRAGHSCIPVGAAGCYAPGGRFPLPSSVLMTTIPARAAGVSSVWVASPRPAAATLAAAWVGEADGLLALGGAQAVGALANGLFGIPACDMIVGPGNKWVTAAKFLVSDRVGIDMLAGPSELVVLADATANARVVAADLLAQAEHDDDAVPILITTSETLIAGVEAELERQLATLPTRATASAALRNGFAVHAPTLELAVRACDRIGPEHLEIMTEHAAAVAAAIRNAGAVFIGPRSAEVLGDYGAGPNHVLPTGGTASFRAGLSVFTFLRARTWLSIDDERDAARLVADAAALARIESLEGHARSAEARSVATA